MTVSRPPDRSAAAPRPDSPPDAAAPSPAALVEAQAAARPDAPAVVSGERSWSYRELNARANRLAHLLIERGVGPDVCAGVCVGRSFDMVAAVPARLQAGPGDATLQSASLSFDVSFQETFAPWATGGALVLVTEEQRRDPAALWGVIAGQRVARVFVPFVVLQQLAEAAAAVEPLPDSLRE